jgi:hypothetical protein
MKAAEESHAVKQRRLEKFRENRPGLFHDYSADFSTDIKVSQAAREHYMYANKADRKLPFSKNYMGSMPMLSPKTGPASGRDQRVLQPWVKNPKQMSSSLASRSKRAGLTTHSHGSESVLPHTTWGPNGACQASMPRAERRTTDWLVTGAPDLREGFLDEKDDWGPDFACASDVEAEMGEAIEAAKTVLSLKLLLKLRGVKPSARSLERLFRRGRERAERRAHRLRMVYGSMHRTKEKRFPEALIHHVSKIGPGEYYSPTMDPLSMWGAETRKSRGCGMTHTYRVPPDLWRTGRSTCSSESGGEGYARREAIGSAIGRLRHERVLARAKFIRDARQRARRRALASAVAQPGGPRAAEDRRRTLGPSADTCDGGADGPQHRVRGTRRRISKERRRGTETGQSSEWYLKPPHTVAKNASPPPLGFELPEDLRGRDVATLRIQLSGIADEERKRVQTESDGLTRENRLLWGAFEHEMNDIRMTTALHKAEGSDKVGGAVATEEMPG